MRCPKCQYLGFEPSPRCKNCGYDFSFGADDLPSLTFVPEPEAMADFDLQVSDASASRESTAVSSRGFDLDDLLAHGRSEPALVMERGSVGAATASAVATPPAADVLRILHEEPAAPAENAGPATAPRSRPDRRPAAAPVPMTTELPLFMQVMSDAPAKTPVSNVRAGMPLTIEAATAAAGPSEGRALEEVDDRPLVQVPAVPRPPLAVRRTTPDPAKLRAKYARAAKVESRTDGDLLRGIDEAEPNQPLARESPAVRLSAEPTPGSLPADWLLGVSAGKRFTAALVDALLLGAIDAAIVWFTLSVCGLRPAQAYLLPLIPILLFFLLVDGGYLVLFTAACGQTIGKMAAGIRVVGTTTGAVINDRITVGQAIARSVGAIASCVPLGAGFWMSLVGDGRALHDRIAHTRVVRA